MIPVSLRRAVLLECPVKVGIVVLRLVGEVVRRVCYGVAYTLAVLVAPIPCALLPCDR
jgi:hypothetical protein